ncbi:MAG: type II toxin-antitoxin system HicB family antitoxin [Ignavibacteriales bacterium]|nr:type II toxin-antitoxin system HicB family antitoxin [Ignavibacteriales bacterium]
MVRKFTLEYWRDKSWYVGQLKEVPGVFSQAKTLSELESNIQEVYQLMIEENESVLPKKTIRTKELGIAV